MSMIMILAVVFFLLILIVGGERGAISLIALAGNILVFMIAVLAMSLRMNPILVTIAGSILINSITLLYQNGKNTKSTAAVLSSAIVTALLLVAVFWFTTRLHIDGLNEIELQSDLEVYYSFNISVNMHLISISMIIIGLLGALMDTAVAISSALYEIYVHNPHLSGNELYHSGITIGKDVLATTLNTLYFAYIGEALLLFVYLRLYKYSLVSILNSKIFLQDFTCIVFSAIGCIIVIPVSSWITAHLVKEEE